MQSGGGSVTATSSREAFLPAHVQDGSANRVGAGSSSRCCHTIGICSADALGCCGALTLTWGGKSTSCEGPSICDKLRRPDIDSRKTRALEWQALSSRWRWLQAAFFYVGAPAHILSRVWPVLLINMLPMVLVTADHLVRVAQTESAVAAGRHVPRTQLGVLPDMSAGLTGSLESLFRYLLFAVSLLLTLRLNRVYDRWWLARQEFEVIGNSVVSMMQRLGNLLGRDDRALLQDLRRWGVVWQYSVMQVCTDAQQLQPDAARLLHPKELELYSASKKGRQLAANRLIQLLRRAELDTGNQVSLDTLFSRAMAAVNTCVVIKHQALPHSLSLVAAGFIEIFLLLMPLTHENLDQDASGDPADRMAVVFSTCLLMIVTLFVNLLVLGADETASTLQDPFPTIPLAAICASTATDCARALDDAAVLSELPVLGDTLCE